VGKRKSASSKPALPAEFIRKLRSVKAKRPKTVIDHILKHGYITTEELSSTYGYEHPPRAARNVREQGIPLETFRVASASGRNIGAYRFGDPKEVRAGRVGGRIAWPKEFKQELIDSDGARCAICMTAYESRYLQIDHRVPFEVAGDPAGKPTSADFMLVCGSCNRAKSWSCEHCPNWRDVRDESICQSCYWASPVTYSHVALRVIRRLDLTWTETEVSHFEHLKQLADHAALELPSFVKIALKRTFPELPAD